MLQLFGLFLQLHHLHASFPPTHFPPRSRKLAVQPQLLCHQIPEPDQTPNNAKDDDDGSQDSETISGHTAATLARIKERVRIPALCGMGDIGESEIACQQDDQKEYM